MSGEYSAKIRDYTNIIKSNDIISKDGEIIELNSECLENIAMDFINLEEQKKEKQQDFIQMKQEQTECQQELLNHCGSFYFNFYNRFDEMENQYLFRFIYLCTYMNYDNFLSNGNRLLREDDLFDILLLGKTECYKTKKIFVDKGLIIINDNKTILVNKNLCKKGKINKTKSIEVVRMFNNAIQELYKKSRPKEHKRLALLIKLLPMINLRFNIVCKNPCEESIENVQPYTMAELCETLGYDKTHQSRLKRDLFKLTINDELVIGIFEKGNGKAIYVNPLLYYKGTKLEDVNSLISMFKVGQ